MPASEYCLHLSCEDRGTELLTPMSGVEAVIVERVWDNGSPEHIWDGKAPSRGLKNTRVSVLISGTENGDKLSIELPGDPDTKTALFDCFEKRSLVPFAFANAHFFIACQQINSIERSPEKVTIRFKGGRRLAIALTDEPAKHLLETVRNRISG